MNEHFYAPIIIPTLNRYEHLRNCLESLQKNTYAKYTDIYISVDYPPSSEYIAGHEKVCNYLKHELKPNFQKINIYFQNKNLGPELNTDFLIEESKMSNDEYFIFTEDDNIFSPVFLEYIDGCIQKYKNNTQIMAICGYCPPKNWYAPNGVFLLDMVCGWGTAFFRNRLNTCIEWINFNNFQQILNNSLICKELFQYNYKKYWILVESCIADFYDKKNVFVSKKTDDIRPIDYTEGLYMTFNHFYAIYPCLSLVENNGFDGSGVNCQKKDINTTQDVLSQYNNCVSDAQLDIKILPTNQQLNNSPEDYKRAKRARTLRFIFVILGKKAAQKYKKLSDYLDYKIYYILKYFKSKIRI